MGLIFSQVSSLVQLIWQLHCDLCQQNGEKGREPRSALCQSIMCKLNVKRVSTTGSRQLTQTSINLRLNKASGHGMK